MGWFSAFFSLWFLYLSHNYIINLPAAVAIHMLSDCQRNKSEIAITDPKSMVYLFLLSFINLWMCLHDIFYLMDFNRYSRVDEKSRDSVVLVFKQVLGRLGFKSLFSYETEHPPWIRSTLSAQDGREDRVGRRKTIYITLSSLEENQDINLTTES